MDRREQIRQGAVKVISERGFHEATTSIIAGAAGVSVGTIYNYFRSKEEILGYIFEVECQRRVNHLHSLLEDESDPPRERLRRFLTAHLDRVRSEPEIARLLLQEFRFSDRTEFLPMRRFASEMPRLLGRLLSQGAADGKDPTVRGLALFGAIQGLTTQMLLAPDTVETESGALVDELTDIFLP